MKKKDISRLLQRYLVGHQEGKDAYFDADEVDELLDSFEESDDYTYYDEVLALGLRLHPGNPDLQIRQCKSYVYNEDYDSALVLIESIAETDNQDILYTTILQLIQDGQPVLRTFIITDSD